MNVMSAADVKNPDVHLGLVSAAKAVVNSYANVHANVPGAVKMTMDVVIASIARVVNVVVFVKNSHVDASLHPRNV